MPKSVLLDPRATVHTPEWLFLSTGIRAVDHAVEDICSDFCQPISEGASFQALRLLGRARSELEFLRPQDLLEDLPTQLAGLQECIREAGEAVSLQYFHSAPWVAWTAPEVS